MKIIQPEPFLIYHAGDGERGKSLVIPLPRGRALRVGWRWQSWCRIGPRRYKLIATPGFVESWGNVMGRVQTGEPMPTNQAKDEIRGMGIEIQGDLTSIDREPQPSDGPDYHADHEGWRWRNRKEGTK